MQFGIVLVLFVISVATVLANIKNKPIKDFEHFLPHFVGTQTKCDYFALFRKWFN